MSVRYATVAGDVGDPVRLEAAVEPVKVYDEAADSARALAASTGRPWRVVKLVEVSVHRTGATHRGRR